MKKLTSHQSTSSSVKKGFTLVELLVVMAIIMALASLGFAGIKVALTKSRVTTTLNLAQNLTGAVQSFMDEYSAMPFDVPTSSDTEYQTDQQDFSKILQILTGKEQGASTKAHVNARDINLFDVKAAKNGLNGIVWQSNVPVKVMDSFGRPFTMVLDGDYNKEITIPTKYRRKGDTDEPVRYTSIVASPGPDKAVGTEKLNKDNVTTW